MAIIGFILLGLLLLYLTVGFVALFVTTSAFVGHTKGSALTFLVFGGVLISLWWQWVVHAPFTLNLTI